MVKQEYLMTKQEMIRDKEVEHVFHKFDQDGNGTIELHELFRMFQDYGVDITKHEL